MTITLHIPDLLNQIVLLSILAGAFSLYDGILRSRSSKLLGIIEIIVAVVLLLSVFFDFGLDVPLKTLAIILEVLLVFLTIFRGGMRRGTITVTVLALVFSSLLLLSVLSWLNLPFLN
jgi:hypothetical protein